MKNARKWLVLVPANDEKVDNGFSGRDAPPELKRYSYHLVKAESARQAWEETKAAAGFNSCRFYLIG